MIVKVSVLVAASFAAFAVSQINSNSTRKQNTLVELQGVFLTDPLVNFVSNSDSDK